MRKLLDGLYDGAAWLAALFMIGVLLFGAGAGSQPRRRGHV